MKKLVFTLLALAGLCLFSMTFSIAHAQISPAHNHYINVVTANTHNHVAITLDACGGQTDMRMLYLLKEKNILATIFVTSKWLSTNPQAISFIKSYPELFRVENHGQNHLSAVQGNTGPYHLPSVHTLAGLEKEVLSAEADIFARFGRHSSWYRTAGALYDEKSISWLESHNFHVAGYTVAADEGATASKPRIMEHMKKVSSDGVILMHLNKPRSQSYEGLKAGLEYLSSKNYTFGFLD